MTRTTVDRRALIAGVAGAASLAAGCGGGRTGETDLTLTLRTDTPTPTPTTAPPVTGTSCTPDTGERAAKGMPTTTYRDTGVEVPVCPDRPDPLTCTTALVYAARFEKAWRSREVLHEGADTITLVQIRPDTAPENVWVLETQDGFLVFFWVTGPYIEYESGNHADPALYRVGYSVSATTVKRVDPPAEVDPRRHGTAVTCPPD